MFYSYESSRLSFSMEATNSYVNTTHLESKTVALAPRYRDLFTFNLVRYNDYESNVLKVKLLLFVFTFGDMISQCGDK